MKENEFVLVIVEGDLDYQFYGEYLSEITDKAKLNIKVTKSSGISGSKPEFTGASLA